MITGEEHEALCRLRDTTDDSSLKSWMVFLVSLFEQKEVNRVSQQEREISGFQSPQGFGDKVTLSVQRKQ